MKVLMFGWEFPPYNSGGLGTACHGLTKGLANHNIKVSFVIPKAYPDMNADFVKLISPPEMKGAVKTIGVNSLLKGYITSKEYTQRYMNQKEFGYKTGKTNDIYGENLFEEVERYAEKAAMIAQIEQHDIIHCHDWLTYEAGINAKRVSGKPLVVHLHATEFDRTAGNPNQYVYEIEKRGFENADKIIAVSRFAKNKIIQHYGINPNKIEVVHNAVEFNDNHLRKEEFKIKKKDKVVLFLGRITVQKGPDWFLYAAKKALEIDPNITFVFAGSGDMEPYIIEKAAELGIADKVLFSGFLRGKDIDRAYQMADLYVMPSVSEPFGITPLEAMRNNTPVIISKQSGVSEVINHCLKVDFWDIDLMVNKMMGVLQHKELKEELMSNGGKEVRKFNWNIPAKKCIKVYDELLKMHIAR